MALVWPGIANEGVENFLRLAAGLRPSEGQLREKFSRPPSSPPLPPLLAPPAEAQPSLTSPSLLLNSGHPCGGDARRRLDTRRRADVESGAPAKASAGGHPASHPET